MKTYVVKVNGKTYKVELESIEESKTTLLSEEVAKKEEVKSEAKVSKPGEGNVVNAPIQGSVIDIKVSIGKKVKKGDVLLIVEAMKLENEVLSTFDGEVSEILVSKGSSVTNGQPLVVIK